MTEEDPCLLRAAQNNSLIQLWTAKEILLCSSYVLYVLCLPHTEWPYPQKVNIC